MKDVFQKELQVRKPELIHHFKTAIARGSTFEESLLAMFHFFAELMPLDTISVTCQNRHGLRFLATVTEQRTVLTDETVPLSAEVQAFFQLPY